MHAPAAEDWRADLARLAARRPEASVRLTVTRGGGERGYRPPPHPEMTRIAMAYPAVLPDPDLAAAGIAVRLCNLRLGLQPRLAGVKHLNRLENVLARMEWDDPEIQEGLLLDQEGRLVSGVSSNLFLHAGGRLQTPRLDRCGVAGVARARLLHAAPGLGLQAEERDLTVADLLAADAVFLCNSLSGLRWVRCLGERVWPRSPRFDALQGCLRD
jgi:4-amino-4-deoxychorismate lyase